MTSWVSKYQHVDVAIRGKKSEAVDPTGRGVDYWFRREIVGFSGSKDGLWLVRVGPLWCIIMPVFPFNSVLFFYS